MAELLSQEEFEETGNLAGFDHSEEFEFLCNAYALALAEIARLREPWVPVAERLPEDGADVFCAWADAEGCFIYDYCSFVSGKWLHGEDEYGSGFRAPKYWQIPSPPSSNP